MWRAEVRPPGWLTPGWTSRGSQICITIPGGSDRVTIAINPIDDNEYEGCESVSLQLRESSGSGSYYYIDAYRSSASVTIAEGDITPAEYEKLVQKHYGGQLNVDVVYNDAGDTQEVDVLTPEYLIQAKKLSAESFENWPEDRLPGNTKAQLERYKMAADRQGKEVIFVTPVPVLEPYKTIMEQDMGIKTAVVPIPAC